MRGHWLYAAFILLAILVILRGRGGRVRKAVLATSALVLGFVGMELPSIHCIVEGICSRMELSFIKPAMWIKLGIVFLPGLLLGRVFCGYVCPKGAAQELVFWRRKIRVPPAVDAWLRWLPYLSLAALVFFPVVLHFRLWTELDPFIWLFQWHGHWAGLILLVVLVPLSLVLFRPFCRYLCPMVPLFHLFSFAPLVRRRSSSEHCHSCKAGMKACDYGAMELTEDERCRVRARDCLQCMSCRQACPEEALR